MLSMVMLVWMDRINQRQRIHLVLALANVVMDLQIGVATSHLSFDEAAIYGNGRGELDRALSDFRKATRLSETILTGGDSWHGLVLFPVRAPELRRRAEDIRRLLAEIGMIARVEWRNAAVPDTALNALDAIFADLERTAMDLESFVEGNAAAYLDHSRRLLLGTLVAWTSIVVAATTGLWRRERTRRDAEEHLRRLSAQLLTAQEAERRRIASDLHDELGHSLVLIKLRLTRIEKDAGEIPAAAQENWRNLGELIDQTVESVRRLSRDLRPAVLEDLGLSAALRWLVDHGITDDRTGVVCSVIDVDHLVSRDAQVVVYRVLQEALTNVVKHAQATRVSLRVERHGDRVSFAVEDDGKGFDVREVMTKHAFDSLGLATMQERAWMIGGSLEIRSEPGNGTRITLSVPA